MIYSSLFLRDVKLLFILEITVITKNVVGLKKNLLSALYIFVFDEYSIIVTFSVMLVENDI